MATRSWHLVGLAIVARGRGCIGMRQTRYTRLHVGAGIHVCIALFHHKMTRNEQGRQQMMHLCVHHCALVDGFTGQQRHQDLGIGAYKPDLKLWQLLHKTPHQFDFAGHSAGHIDAV